MLRRLTDPNTQAIQFRQVRTEEAATVPKEREGARGEKHLRQRYQDLWRVQLRIQVQSSRPNKCHRITVQKHYIAKIAVPSINFERGGGGEKGKRADPRGGGARRQLARKAKTTRRAPARKMNRKRWV